MGIHLDMQGGVGTDPDGIGPATNPNIIKITNSVNNSNPAQGGVAIFHGDSGAWGQGNLVFAGIASATGAIDPKMVINTVSGNVGIGTITPGAKLEVAGQIKITGGAPALGKVLTSDANGLAAWESVPGVVESDPIWTAASANYYTQTNLQTSGQSNVHWGNLTNIPVGIAWSEVSSKPAACTSGEFITDIANGTCAAPTAAAAEADTLNTVTGRGNTTTNSVTVSNATIGGDIINNNWKILARGSDWAEEAVITLNSAGSSFNVDDGFNDQRVNTAIFSWPDGSVNEIMFMPKNTSEAGWCVGGNFIMNITSNAGGTSPKCTDFYNQADGSVFRQEVTEDDAIQIAIDGVDMIYCPDQYGRNGSLNYPGTQGEYTYFDPICHYKAGTDYASSTISVIEIKEIDWSPSYGAWHWEIWYR